MGKKYFLGIDVGGTFTKMALMSGSGRLVAKSQISSKGFSNKSFFAQEIKKAFLLLVRSQKMRISDVLGIGIGLPGPIDSERGVVFSLTNIKRWNNFPLVSFLKKFFPVSISIENDANCMALAESRIGAAHGASFALCVTLGTGVGGGLILNGEIYRGPYFLGGEIGHIPLALEGPRCKCGGVACLEQYVGNQAVKRKIRSVFKGSLSLEEVGRRARSGDARALKVWRQVGEHIGLALSGVVNTFNPEVIVIGGGVSFAGDVLFGSIRATVKKHAMRFLKKRILIKKAVCGKDAGVLGAALLAKEKVRT
jgi:glucokinase